MVEIISWRGLGVALVLGLSLAIAPAAVADEFDDLIYDAQSDDYDTWYNAEPDVAARMEKGENVEPEELYFRTTPRFETGSNSYGWLNRLITVGVGQETPTTVEYRIYAVL